MTKDPRQASDIGDVPERSDCRVEHLPSVVVTGFKYDRERLISERTAGPITDLGQDVEAQDPLLQSQSDSQARPMNPIDLAAETRDPNSEPIGSLFGMALVLDAAIPTNLGAGTNEDRIVVTRADDHILLEGEPRLRVHVDASSGSGTLTVRFTLVNYVALLTQRVPSSTGVLAGTGLIAPVFA